MKNLLPILAVLGGAYLLAGKPGTPTPAPAPGPVLPPPSTDQSGQGQTGNQAVSGIEKIGNPDFNKWRAKEWSSWFKQLSKELGPKNALAVAWNHWNNKENRYYRFFDSPQALLLGMAQGEVSAKILSTEVAGYVIDEYSQPVYDTWSNMWYGIVPWTCNEWKIWHQKLKARWGQMSANNQWKQAWENPDNFAWGSIGNDCPQDCDFYRYIKGEGIVLSQGPLSSIASWAYCDVSQVVTNTTNAVIEVTEGVEATGKAAKFAIPVLAAAGVYFYFKNKKKGKK